MVKCREKSDFGIPDEQPYVRLMVIETSNPIEFGTRACDWANT